MKFRKKPVVIEAFQLNDGVYSDPEKWPEWVYKGFGAPGRGRTCSVFKDVKDLSTLAPWRGP